MDQKTESGPGIERFRTFDPKSPPGKATDSGIPLKESVVFVVGGGNYAEKESIELWANSQVNKKQIIYGATEIISPDDFLEGLNVLAKKR